MRHSLRFRLIAVTAILPMLTIASAGWFIRDANVQTFGDDATFTVATGGLSDLEPGIQSDAGGSGTTIISSGSFDTLDVSPSASAWLLNSACQPPVTTLSGFAATTDDPLPELNAVPIVYSSSTGAIGASQYVMLSQPAFVQAYEADRASALSSLNWKVATVIGLAGLVCGTVGMAASQRIIGPVQALTGAARELESGDLSRRVEHRSNDEIGQLSHAFNAMADSLQRTEALRKTMTSDVAHELRTPLNNISGFVDMLADGLVQADSRVLSTLQEETQILVTLVNDLEQLSIGDAGQILIDPAEADLEKIAERAIHAMSPRASERGIGLSLESPDAPVVAEVDITRIDQVLRNLLENAIRHTPDGGAVTVLVERDAESNATIVIEDTGPGIDPEHLPNVFERFYRADPSRTRGTGGSGLGLAIARQLVEAHGGTISAGKGTSGGARFTIRIPRA